MPMDEVIRAIEKTDTENIQDVLQATIGRYRELYPGWKILFLSTDCAAMDQRSQKILELMCQIEQIIAQS